jgi:hypothetical protein
LHGLYDVGGAGLENSLERGVCRPGDPGSREALDEVDKAEFSMGFISNLLWKTFEDHMTAEETPHRAEIALQHGIRVVRYEQFLGGSEWRWSEAICFLDMSREK